MGRTSRRLAAAVIATMLAAIPAIPATGSIDDLLSSSELLNLGDRGSLVRDLQEALQTAGQDPGPIDGIFGPMTDRAVRRFQRQASIVVDGLVGPGTRRAIGTAVGRSPNPSAPASTSPSTPALSPGARGPAVVSLQRELARTGLYRGPIDGAFGPMTASAVMAFHKVWGLDRTTTWTRSDWNRISGWWPSAPGYGSAAYRIEVDLARQVLFVVRDARVAAVMPISSGNGEYYTNWAGNRVRAHTPTGDFVMQRSVDGWDSSYLGELYEPWYFYGGYAIHGSHHVPAWPASHGCVRVSIADSLWLDARMWIGMPVHVRG
ncbi:MAG: peptidoglycan-binding protein [Acidimicrobiia bacterium]|nr:peptidoglycan-binding protein [Acidimicrobiia bacterium]